MQYLKIYKLYAGTTADCKDYDDIMGALFSEYTKYQVAGAWKGLKESSIVYEMIFLSPYNKEKELWDKMQVASEEIKRVSGQESVLITITDSIGEIFTWKA